MKSMPQAYNQEDVCYAQLYATYRSEWQAFAQETREWRCWKTKRKAHPEEFTKQRPLPSQQKVDIGEHVMSFGSIS